MITYNPKDWVSFIFLLHKSDTFRKLWPSIIAISLYSAGIAFLELEYWQLSQNHPIKQISVMHTLLSFVISMLLVFRTNSAYDRWWEGRKLWGSLVNSSRNLAMKLNALLPLDDAQNRAFFKKMIPMYASLLSSHLRSEHTRLALDEKEHPELATIDNKKHMPNQVASLITQRVVRLNETGLIKGDQLLFINAEVQNFTDVCGACERIKNTPIPYSYSAFLKKFIFVYVLSLPLSFVFTLGYLAIPIVAFIFYVLASLELIAEEIEDPFGGDSNDLPTEKIADNIKKHLAEIIH